MFSHPRSSRGNGARLHGCRLFFVPFFFRQTSAMATDTVNSGLRGIVHHLRMQKCLQRYGRGSCCQALYQAADIDVYPCRPESVLDLEHKTEDWPQRRLFQVKETVVCLS